MHTFKALFDTHNWDSTLKSILNKTTAEVRQALVKEKLDLEDFKALISPAAKPFWSKWHKKVTDLPKKDLGIPFRCMPLCI